MASDALVDPKSFSKEPDSVRGGWFAVEREIVKRQRKKYGLADIVETLKQAKEHLGFKAEKKIHTKITCQWK